MIELFQGGHEGTFYSLCKRPLKKIIDIEKLHRRMGLNILSHMNFVFTNFTSIT